MRKLLMTLPALAALGAALGGCGVLTGPGSFETAWDACVESFERQPMHHWDNGEIVKTIAASRSCNAYLEDLGRYEFALSFNLPEWVAVKEENRGTMDIYHDSQLPEND